MLVNPIRRFCDGASTLIAWPSGFKPEQPEQSCITELCQSQTVAPRSASVTCDSGSRACLSTFAPKKYLTQARRAFDHRRLLKRWPALRWLTVWKHYLSWSPDAPAPQKFLKPVSFRERPVATLTKVQNMPANLRMRHLMERSVLLWPTVVLPNNRNSRRRRFLYLIATHCFHLAGLRSQGPSAPSVSEMNGSNDGLLADWLTTRTRTFSLCWSANDAGRPCHP